MTLALQHCKDCVDLLGEYIEGTLSPEQSAALEEHLSTCPPCITFVRTYRATRRLCRKHLAKDMPGELMNSLSSFLEKHVPGFGCEKTDAAAPAELADKAPKKV